MIRTWRLGLLLLPLVLAHGEAAYAHEVRPAYLEVVEIEPGRHQVTWKQPLLGDMRLSIDPVLPEQCKVVDQDVPENTGSALIQRWQVACDLSTGTISIRGLTRTLTDVLVRIVPLDGPPRNELLRADEPSLNLGDPPPPLTSYLTLGIDHLLFGFDHILFVIGLVLFIRDRWMLLKTITAFTVAHSITLALSVLGVIKLPQPPVEAVIALSILFLARELVVPPERQGLVTRLHPWVMAFAFGLLHGFGFAGALIDIGLPKDQLAVALFLFNVGIEVGQLLVIGVLFASAWVLLKVPLGHWPLWRQAFTLVMGSMAGYWTIDRIAAVL